MSRTVTYEKPREPVSQGARPQPEFLNTPVPSLNRHTNMPSVRSGDCHVFWSHNYAEEETGAQTG